MKSPSAGRETDYVICESYPGYRNHIRRLDAGELKPGGGLEAVALCGHVFGSEALHNGWDKPEVKLTLEYAESMKTGLAVRYCEKCVSEYKRLEG